MEAAVIATMALKLSTPTSARSKLQQRQIPPTEEVTHSRKGAAVAAVAEAASLKSALILRTSNFTFLSSIYNYISITNKWELIDVVPVRSNQNHAPRKKSQAKSENLKLPFHRFMLHLREVPKLFLELQG